MQRFLDVNNARDNSQYFFYRVADVFQKNLYVKLSAANVVQLLSGWTPLSWSGETPESFIDFFNAPNEGGQIFCFQDIEMIVEESPRNE
jgi:hypothetical protein